MALFGGFGVKMRKAFSDIKGSGTYLKSWSQKSGPIHKINKAFENVTGLGNFLPHDIKEDQSFVFMFDVRRWHSRALLRPYCGHVRTRDGLQ